MVDNSNVFKAAIKGVFVGFFAAFLFALFATEFHAMGATYPFLTSVPAMGLFGFILGFGLETYPALM